MKKFIIVAIIIAVVVIIVGSIGGCSVCSNQAMHGKYFTKDGLSVNDTAEKFSIVAPKTIHVFMESSGSMNGFLRAGVPTSFKTDLWEILSVYRDKVASVNVLSSDNGSTSFDTMDLSQFQTPLNSGGFVSAQSTNLCQMLRTVTDTIHADKDEVAVFVSDMEYDPVGAVAPSVLQSVYSTDIATILSDFGYSVAMVAATSNSVDKNGVNLTTRRPYYYLILGKQECVAYVRNGISAMLAEQQHFVDNIEAGFDYGAVDYTFGNYSGCTRVGSDASFKSMSNAGCKISLELNLDKYRWLLATDKDVLSKSLEIKSMSGGLCKIDGIECVVDKKLDKWHATARVEISISGMARDCDVIIWNINVPTNDTSNLQQLFTDTPNSTEQTYSIREFIIGMFRAKLACTKEINNYIHISKN